MTSIIHQTDDSINETLSEFNLSIRNLNKILKSEETSIEIDGIQKSTLKHILSSLGLFSPVEFQSDINVNNFKFTVMYQNQLYIPKRELPFTTTGNFDPDDWHLLHTDYILQTRNEVNFNRMIALGNDITFIMDGLLYITDNTLDATSSVASDLNIAGIGIPKYTKRKLAHYGITLPEITSSDYQRDQQSLTPIQEENYRTNLNNFNKFINDHEVGEIINLSDEYGKLNIIDTFIIENRNIIFNKEKFLINSYATDDPIIEIFSDNSIQSSIDNLTINGNGVVSHGIKLIGGSIKLNNIDILYPNADVIHISQDEDKQYFEKIDISNLQSRYGNIGNGINIIFPTYTTDPNRTSIEYLNLSNIYIFNSGISDISISFNDDSLDTNLLRYINNFNIKDSYFRYSHSFITTDGFTPLDFSTRLNSSIIMSRGSNSKGYINNFNMFNYKTDLEDNIGESVISPRHRNGLEITDLLDEVNDFFDKNVIYNFISYNTHLGIYYTWWDHTDPSENPLSKKTSIFNIQDTNYQITYNDIKFIYTNISSGLISSNYKDNKLHDLLHLAEHGETLSKGIVENGFLVTSMIEDKKVLIKAMSNNFREIYKVVICTQPEDDESPIYLEAKVISGYTDDDLTYHSPIIKYIITPETSTLVSDYTISLVTYSTDTDGSVYVVNNTDRNLELVYSVEKII